MSHDLIAAIPFPALLIGGDDRISDANRLAADLLGSSLQGRHHATILRQPLLLDAIETAARTRVPAEARYLGPEERVREFPADMPPPREFVTGWRIGEPDQIVKMASEPTPTIVQE